MLKFLKLILIFVLVPLIFPKTAHAYLDPGSGSYLIQVIVATLAGAGYFFRANWGKVKKMFSKKDQKRPDEKEDN